MPGEDGLARLLAVMARLRDPDGGCPWDLEQDFSSIAPYTIEEAYEVADAIERGDLDDLEGELGDLLLQVVYHARMAEEQGRFDFETVASRIADKMIARHPHVFGDAEVDGATAQSRAWEDTKARERSAKDSGDASVLADVPVGLPALTRAGKLQRRAARVGFDWADVGPVLAKLEEELGEVRAELAVGAPRARLVDELGDLLFAAANLARHLGVDGESALRQANRKFERRFRAIETALHAAGRDLDGASLDEMEALWQAAKGDETPTAAVATTATALSAIYRDYIACLNRQDWPMLGQFVDDEVSYNGKQIGLSGYRALLENDFRAIPDLYFDVQMVMADPPHVASRLQFDCTPTGAFLGLPVDGQNVSFAENVFYAFRQAKILHVWSVIDKAAIEAQLSGAT